MGPAYWIPAFWVPALLVTHCITFVILADSTAYARAGAGRRAGKEQSMKENIEKVKLLARDLRGGQGIPA